MDTVEQTVQQRSTLVRLGMLVGIAGVLAAIAIPNYFADDTTPCVVTTDASGIRCSTLFAGQEIDAGTVCVSVSGDSVDVTYDTTGGWELVEAHLWWGTSLADMPQTRTGNPKIGNFPHNSGDITGATTYTFSVRLADMGFSCPGDDVTYAIAAHAAVRKDNGDGTYQTETGWSDGSRIADRGSWATYSEFTLTCDCGNLPPPPALECETAFAYSGADATCFLSVDEDGDGDGDFNRWGWSNGPLAQGSYEWEIYAGAGQCDLSKGTLVGTLRVDYNDSTVTVTYAVDAPYTLWEAHVYSGSEILARDGNDHFTVAPGQYSVVEEFEGTTQHTTTVTGLDGGAVYVVAHAVVCGF